MIWSGRDERHSLVVFAGPSEGYRVCALEDSPRSSRQMFDLSPLSKLASGWAASPAPVVVEVVARRSVQEASERSLATLASGPTHLPSIAGRYP